VIYTLHDRAPWQAGIRAGLHARIEQIPQATRPVVYEEWLDASRLPGPQAEAAFLALLAGRYAGVKLDAVAAESEAAINLLNRHPELFPGAKRYLVGTSVKVDAVGDADVVRLEEDPVGALQSLSGVLPDTRKLVVIVGRTPYGEAIAAKVRAAAGTLPAHTMLDIWDDFTFDELLQRAGQLPPKSAILWFPVFADKTGARKLPVDTLRALLAKASAPVFSHHDVNLGLGVVGGYMLSAKQSGDLIAQVLLGSASSAGDAALHARTKGHFFDDRALQRWGIGDQNLPPESVILNRTVPVWVTYRWHIAAAMLAIVLQTILIAALVRNLRQRKHAMRALALERETLERRVSERTVELQQTNEKLAQLSVTDALTGVANRRRFDEVLDGEWQRAYRAGQPLALGLVDVDHFKKFNDHHGHQAGDECLRQVAKALQGTVRRGSDLVARYGGEEFVLICAATSAEAAAALARSFCEALQEMSIAHPTSGFGVVTASVGVAAITPQAGQSPQVLVEMADKLLYEAKAQGRNRVVVAQTEQA
jgi:diguanylate cyclase (GGDEF)-like protein